MLALVQKKNNENERKKFKNSIDRINKEIDNLLQLSDTALRQKTSEFKYRLAVGETLNDLLPEAYAVKNFNFFFAYIFMLFCEF